MILVHPHGPSKTTSILKNERLRQKRDRQRDVITENGSERASITGFEDKREVLSFKECVLLYFCIEIVEKVKKPIYPWSSKKKVPLLT